MNNQNAENSARLLFYRELNDLIFRSNEFTSKNHAYESRRLCVLWLAIQNILKTAHDDSHLEFARCYEKIFSSYYIRGLSRYCRDFLKHYSKCQAYQTRRHKSYDSLQSILTSSISFHTITIDFVLTLPSSVLKRLDCLMSISCKYSKRIVLVFDKITFSAVQWRHALLNRLDIVDWDLSKAIISNRDRKFLFDMWEVMFSRLEIELLYSTTYHSQTDEQSERTNQTIEIALRFLISTLKHSNQWFEILLSIQRDFNNSSSSTNQSSNEIAYDFTSVQALNLFASWKSFADLSLKKSRLIIRTKVFDAIAFDQINVKFHYNRKHASLHLRKGNYTLLRLHKEYNISSIASKKINQQYVGPFLVIERIENLTYRLDILDHWRIHLVFSIAQLKSCLSSFVDSFQRPRLDHSNFVFVKRDTNKVKSFVLDRVIDKREIKTRGFEYLVR